MMMLGSALHRAGQAYARTYARQVRKAHETKDRRILTLRQMQVAEAIYKNPMSQHSICEATGIDRSTLATMVRSLEENGIVERRRSGDMRQKIVRLTLIGEGLYRDAVDIRALAERDFAHRLRSKDRVTRTLKLLEALAED